MPCTPRLRRYFWTCSPSECRLQVESVGGKASASEAIQSLSGPSVTDQLASFTAGLPSLTPVLHVSSDAPLMICRSDLILRRAPAASQACCGRMSRYGRRGSELVFSSQPCPPFGALAECTSIARRVQIQAVLPLLTLPVLLLSWMVPRKGID